MSARTAKQVNQARKKPTVSLPSVQQAMAMAQAALVSGISSGLELGALIDRAANLVEAALPGATCVIEVLGTSSSPAAKSSRLRDGFPTPHMLPHDQLTLLAAAVASGETTIAASFLKESRWLSHGFGAIAAGLSSAIAIPFVVDRGGPCIGALAVYFSHENGATDEVRSCLEMYAAVVSQLPKIMKPDTSAVNADKQFQELASTIPGVVYQRVVRPDGDVRYSYISAGATELFGVDPETIVRDPQALFNHYAADYRASFKKKLIEASKSLSIWDVEAQIMRPDGSIRYTHAIAHPRKLSDGSVLWTGVILDATRMKLAEIEAAEMESKTREAIVESFSQGLLLYGADGRLVVRNSRFIDVNPGMEAVAVPGARYEDILAAELGADRADDPAHSGLLKEYEVRLEKHRAGQNVVCERQIASDRWILINDNPTSSGGKVVLYTDVSELKRRERHIEHIAHHDALTGLPNRVLFHKKLEQALVQGNERNHDVAVVYIDLDRFKGVNDTLGHPIGDALLQIVGHRIRECLNSSDVAARLGGDEFAIVVSHNAASEPLTTLAWRLIDVLGRPAEIDGHSVVVGASVGIAIGRGGPSFADDLLKSADLAVYRAKADGKGTFRFFESSMDAIAQERRKLEMDLRVAIKTGQLHVFYQPQVDVFTAQMVGAEALLRWFHPTRGKVPPSEFIPLAEETGLITEIGPWVLRRACEDAVSWPLATRVAVNASPAQFQNGAFLDHVRQTLQETGLDPSRLEIEITETMLLRNTESNLKTLWGLKELGVRVSMDDFGTGYSSLGNLRSFPFDKIKIDRSFVGDLKHNVDAAAIIRAVVSLGRSLGITTTAEGVETRDQLTYLRAEGCSEVQGFYYSEAQPCSEIHRMLVNSPSGTLNPR
ncbi:GGDEF domain [Rhabdaerophilaceae bacterium]